MNVLSIDMGGTSVKYGVVSSTGEVLDKGSFNLGSGRFEEIKHRIFELFRSYHPYEIAGLAFSLPGSVDSKEGVVGGVSAIPSIHGPNFFDAFEELGVPITIENDANCAALAETWIGVSKDHKDSVFIVVGTGIGGAIVKDKKLHYGAHLHGGEFGYMIADVLEGQEYSFSDLASMKGLVEEVYRRTGKELTGVEIFADSITHESSLTRMYRYIASLIYNLQYAIDPDCFVLGGGVSANPLFIEGVKDQLEQIVNRGYGKMRPVVLQAKFRNDANLIGAVYYHLHH